MVVVKGKVPVKADATEMEGAHLKEIHLLKLKQVYILSYFVFLYFLYDDLVCFVFS